METFRDLIARWPTVAEFGREIDVSYQTARKMNDRISIRNVHWPAVIAAAKKRGIHVTIEKLSRMIVNSRRMAEEEKKDGRADRRAAA